MINTQWYEGFFEGIVVDMWQQATSPESTRREVDFLVKYLQLQPGQRILDLPCGYGRHAIELSRRGYQVTGMDVSAQMIAAARSHAAAANVQVDWLVAEMREIPPALRVDAAFCFGNSFGYLNRAGTLDYLRKLAHTVPVGGRFAFEYGMAAEAILPRLAHREWFPLGDMYFLEENEYHIEESCVETTYTFIRGGEVETRQGIHWVFTISELKELLHAAGWQLTAMFGSHRGQPFMLGSPLLLGIAERI